MGKWRGGIGGTGGEGEEEQVEQVGQLGRGRRACGELGWWDRWAELSGPQTEEPMCMLTPGACLREHDQERKISL